MLSGGRSIGINRKQAAEWIGGIDAWEDQVRRELASPNIDYLYCLIEGFITQSSNGVTSHSFQDNHSWKGNTVEFKINYKYLMGLILRSHELGVPVFFTDSILGSSIFLAELHSICEREDWDSDIFLKLNKTRYQISEPEKIRRDYILFLMGIPGVGEEVATALVNEFSTFVQMLQYMSEGKSLAGIVIASGRKIGPSVEKKIKEFWGLV